MFYGEYLHSLDDKDRIVLPSKFREISRKNKITNFYLTRGLDKCLFLFPSEEWIKIEKTFKEFPFTKEENRAFARLLFSGATEVQLDSQGRFLIPQYLKEFASINKEIIIIGVSNRIEIWAKELWEQYYQLNKQKFEEIAQKLMI